eukprot:TRINITY_DN14180_c0_g1_i2.p1 TRINITY_DN14180_c0_g1~~TRINITY_DN14180_c0_g1_i2.p1  ORF type:complete len:830 (+),score=179.57 TRINITY_DN14180_c0_g1_i2:98-2491(+)
MRPRDATTAVITIAALHTLADAASPQLTAVCIAGGVRTLATPVVYRSIQANVLRPLAPTRVFALLKLYEDRRAFCTGSGNTLRDRCTPAHKTVIKQLKPALRCLAPDMVRYTRTAAEDGVLMRDECKIEGTFGTPQMHARYTGQMKALWRCAHEVKSYEAENGVRFAAVLRLRPDLVFFAPVPPLGQLLHTANGGVLWSASPPKAMSDLVLFLPRARLGLLSSWWEQYLRCNGTWTLGENPERALYNLSVAAGIVNADGRFAMMLRRNAGATGVRDLRTIARTFMWHCVRDGPRSAVASVEECWNRTYLDLPDGCHSTIDWNGTVSPVFREHFRAILTEKDDLSPPPQRGDAPPPDQARSGLRRATAGNRSAAAQPQAHGTAHPCRVQGNETSCIVQGKSYEIDFDRCRRKLDADSLRVSSAKLLRKSGWVLTVADGQQLMFKPECRPALMTYGQQGWTEVASQQVAQALLGRWAWGPCVSGAVVRIPPSSLRQSPQDEVGKCGRVPGRPGHYAGAVVEWMPWMRHHDFPPYLRSAWKIFRPREHPRLNRTEARWARQITVLFALDFVLLNADRVVNNWAILNGRLEAVDNGAAFGGPGAWWNGWNGSVCDDTFGDFLDCPSMLQLGTDPRGIMRSQWDCRGGEEQHTNWKGCGKSRRRCAKAGVRWCLFPQGFVKRIRGFLQSWKDGLSAAWQRGLLADPLFKHLMSEYNTWGSGRVHRFIPDDPERQVYSNALWRFVHGCPGAPTAQEADKAAPVTPPELVSWLAYGIGRRARSLLRHVDRCVRDHGKEYVFQLA